MYWSFENFHSPDYVLISTGGIFTHTDFANMFDELFRLDYWCPLMPLLLDESELEIWAASTEQLAKAAETFLDQNSMLAYTRIAVVLASPKAMRVVERFGNAIGSQSKAVIEVFSDRKQAEDWLHV
jgi:hypothetical protein